MALVSAVSTSTRRCATRQAGCIGWDAGGSAMAELSNPITIESRVVPFPRKEEGDPEVGVLLQLPDGFVILKSDDARHLANLLVEVADDADAHQEAL